MPLSHLWTTPGRARHFLVPEAAVPYEVTEAEAQAWLEGQLKGLLGEVRSGGLGVGGRLRAKTAAMREERKRAVDDFIRQARTASGGDPSTDTP